MRTHRRRHCRRRPGRARHEPLPEQPWRRPCRARAGPVAERWRSERWDSLRLLTPNWMTRLPGFVRRGRARRLHDRATSSPSSKATRDRCTRPSRRTRPWTPSGRRVRCFRVTTTRGVWPRARRPRHGPLRRPRVPAMATRLDGVVHQSSARLSQSRGSFRAAGAGGRRLGHGRAARRRDPAGPAGRPFGRAAHAAAAALSRTRHLVVAGSRRACSTRPRTVYDLGTSRHQPSFQLVGRPDGGTLDLERCATRACACSAARRPSTAPCCASATTWRNHGRRRRELDRLLSRSSHRRRARRSREPRAARAFDPWPACHRAATFT